MKCVSIECVCEKDDSRVSEKIALLTLSHHFEDQPEHKLCLPKNHLCKK